MSPWRKDTPDLRLQTPDFRHRTSDFGHETTELERFMARDFKKIKAWQKADDLAVNVYEITRTFPKEEIYGMTSQMRRAAISVAANIAEGSARNTVRDYLHFLNLAEASLIEVEYYVHLGGRLGYISSAKVETLQGMKEEAGRTLCGLIKTIRENASES